MTTAIATVKTRRLMSMARGHHPPRNYSRFTPTRTIGTIFGRLRRRAGT